jgi:hypothetical protein
MATALADPCTTASPGGATLRIAEERDLDTLAHNIVVMADESEVGAHHRVMSVSTSDSHMCRLQGRKLDPATVRLGVLAVLQDASKGFYVVAEVQGAFAGCLMITKEWSEWNNGEYALRHAPPHSLTHIAGLAGEYWCGPWRPMMVMMSLMMTMRKTVMMMTVFSTSHPYLRAGGSSRSL